MARQTRVMARRTIKLSLGFGIWLTVSSMLLGADSQEGDIVSPIVSVQWLQKQREKTSLIQIVDTRQAEDYFMGHIPDALNLPVDLTFDVHGNRSRIATLEKIQQNLRKIGLKNSHYIILYDGGYLRDAAHVFWVLETYGHKRISVLDGGLSAWIQANGPLSHDPVKAKLSDYTPHIMPNSLSTLLTTRLAIENENVVIIDSRIEEEYVGKTTKARRKGHIPSAINIPWIHNLNIKGDTYLVKSDAELNEIYHAVDKKREAIVYCNLGKESALTYLIMRNLGRQVSVYDGAWLEWGNNSYLPVVQGSHPVEQGNHKSLDARDVSNVR